MLIAPGWVGLTINWSTCSIRPRRAAREGERGSDAVDGDSSAEATRESRQVIRIARDDEVAPLQRPYDDRRVDEVGEARTTARDARRAASTIVEILDLAASQKA